MVKNIDQNLWVAEQSFRYWGLNVGTRMTIIRLLNNELVIISPIEITTEITDEIDRLGVVKHIILPNLFHHLFALDWNKKYPDALVYAVSDLSKKRPDIAIDRYLDNNELYFAQEVEYLPFQGIKTITLKGISPLGEYVFFHSQSKTLILTDTAFYFDESFSLTTQIVSRLIGGYKQLQPSLLELIATKEKEKVSDSVQKIRQWNFQRIIVAHGNIVEQNASEKLKKAYQNLIIS